MSKHASLVARIDDYLQRGVGYFSVEVAAALLEDSRAALTSSGDAEAPVSGAVPDYYGVICPEEGVIISQAGDEMGRTQCHEFINDAINSGHDDAKHLSVKALYTSPQPAQVPNGLEYMIFSDLFVMQFQSLGQYRTALMNAWRNGQSTVKGE